jgi:hypothetical protein
MKSSHEHDEIPTHKDAGDRTTLRILKNLAFGGPARRGCDLNP